MALTLGDQVLDAGLAALDNDCDKIFICSAKPTTYTEATATFALGNKNWGAGAAFTAPAAGSPDGRIVNSVAITNGSVTGTGTATHWAAVDSAASRLLATDVVAASLAVTSGQQFTLASFAVHMLGAAAGGLLDGSESDGTNLITSGGTGMTAGWGPVEATFTNATTTDPSGGSAASSLIESANNTRHILSRSETGMPADTNLTFSVYAKMNGRRYLVLNVADLATGSAEFLTAIFDLQAGAVTDSDIVHAGTGTAIVSTAIAAAVNGFYKCSLTYKIDTTTTGIYLQFFMSNVATYGAPLQFDAPQYTGDGSSLIYLWRPKLAA